jgi:hypothetical protein
MKKISLILAVLILFSGCTTIARVNTPREIRQGVYTIRIPEGYARDEKALKYAINEFVKSKGHESYDAQITETPSFFKNYYVYTITVPGATPVENLPNVRVFNQDGTELLIYIIAAPVGAFLAFFMLFWWLF